MRAFVLALLLACAPAPVAPRAVPATTAGDPEQKIAQLGTCPLASGARIVDCRIGYRTFGRLDAAKSNAIVVPTWFTGTTKPLVEVFVNRLVDTNRFFLVLVDALGDGVSSSPSNSAAQARLAFPRITIADMVDSERRLIREKLGIDRLYAVMGISMGGMQAVEWATRYPTEVERVVSIVGTPQLTSHDLLLWNTELRALASDVAYKDGNYEGRPALHAVLALHQFALTTPEHRARETRRDAFSAWFEKIENDATFDWNDWRRQLEAMLLHDIARSDGGSLEKAAARVRAKALFVVASQDHMVHPAPSIRFARALNAPLVVLDSACGHLAPTCEADRLAREVRTFLGP